jgi:hypothetical protein
MPTYVKLPCTCGSSRYYEQQVGWNGFDAVTQPFCGDCNRLLDTYKEGTEWGSIVTWVSIGVIAVSFIVILLVLSS